MANKENIRLWVDALRSGKYKQGVVRLRSTDDKFCCLGVACDISPFEWQKITTPISADDVWKSWECDGEKNVLPASVAEWLGIDTSPTVEYHNSDLSDFFDLRLWVLNDAMDLDFDEIADLIEEKWLS